MRNARTHKIDQDGDEVKPGDGVSVEALPDGTNRLKIDAAKAADQVTDSVRDPNQFELQGNYRVEATNAAGTESSKAPLTVNGEFRADSENQS